MAAPAWAQKPMPPGWEAKYDQRSRKYFFVNHANKNTQWVDPRIAYYGNQQYAPAQNYAPAPMQQQPARVHRPAEQIAMQPIVKHKCTTCRMTDMASANQVCHSCQAAAQQREAALVRAKEEREAAQKKREHEERIKQEQERRRVQSAQRRAPQPQITETNFGAGGEEEAHEVPTLTMTEKIKLVNDLQEIYTDVTRSVIDMVLESCSYNKETASSILNSMSTKKAPPKQPTPVRARSPSPATQPAPVRAPSPSPQAAQPAHVGAPSSSPQARGRAAAPKSSPAAAPAPKQLTPFEKAQVRSALKKAYPKASGDLITMALESTNYDQTKAGKVLGFTMSDDTKAKAKAKVSALSKASTSSTPASASTSTPSTSSTVTIRSASPKPTASQPIPKPKTVPDKTKKTAARKASPSPSRQAKESKARQKTARPDEIATIQAEFASSFSSMAKGRDPSLASGPNKDLLIDNYVHEGGADPTLSKGPNPDYTVGPTAGSYVGPTAGSFKSSSLASGPQASLRSGPQASFAKGSLYQGDRQS